MTIREPTDSEMTAAKAMCLARKPKHPSLNNDDEYWETHGSKDIYITLARAALLAVAQSRPAATATATVHTAMTTREMCSNPECKCKQTPVAPEGWQLVPKEPTNQMCDAGGTAFFEAAVEHEPGNLKQSDRPFRRYYRAMLAASPSPPNQTGD